VQRSGRPERTHRQTDRQAGPTRIHARFCRGAGAGARSTGSDMGEVTTSIASTDSSSSSSPVPIPHAKRVPWTGGATIRITSPRNGSTSNRLVTSLLCLLYVDRILNAYRVLQLELVRMSAVYDDKIENPSSSPVPAK